MLCRYKLPRKPSSPLSTGRALMLTRPQAPVTFTLSYVRHMVQKYKHGEISDPKKPISWLYNFTTGISLSGKKSSVSKL